jgi:hypothetical protein
MNRTTLSTLRGFVLLWFSAGIMAGAIAAQKQTEPIKVFVFIAPHPPGVRVNPNLVESLEELKKDLSLNKSPIVQIVSAQTDADVALQVIACGSKHTGSTSVAVNLTSGTYSNLIEGTTNTSPNQVVGFDVICQRAANAAAKEIAKWINGNYDHLLSRRFAAPLAAAEHAACTPDMRTASCREAVTKSMEARIQKTAPGAKASAEGTDSEELVFKWQTLLDDPKIRTMEEHEKDAENFCRYGFKRVIVVGTSDISKYEFELDCPVKHGSQ